MVELNNIYDYASSTIYNWMPSFGNTDRNRVRFCVDYR